MREVGTRLTESEFSIPHCNLVVFFLATPLPQVTSLLSQTVLPQRKSWLTVSVVHLLSQTLQRIETLTKVVLKNTVTEI